MFAHFGKPWELVACGINVLTCIAPGSRLEWEDGGGGTLELILSDEREVFSVDRPRSVPRLWQCYVTRRRWHACPSRRVTSRTFLQTPATDMVSDESANFNAYLTICPQKRNTRLIAYLQQKTAATNTYEIWINLCQSNATRSEVWAQSTSIQQLTVVSTRKTIYWHLLLAMTISYLDNVDALTLINTVNEDSD